MAHPQIIMKDEPLPFYEQATEIIDPFEMNTVGIQHVGDKTVYHYAQDVSEVCNQNEIDRKEGSFDSGKEFRKVASVPMVIWNLWESMGIVGDQKALRKALQAHQDEYMTTDKRLI